MNTKEAELKEGMFAMCWYWKIPSMISEGLELYWCKIIKLGNEYSTCELYFGEELNPSKLKGTFDCICTNDIQPVKFKL